MKKYAGEKDCILVEKTLMGDSLAYEELVIRHENIHIAKKTAKPS